LSRKIQLNETQKLKPKITQPSTSNTSRGWYTTNEKSTKKILAFTSQAYYSAKQYFVKEHYIQPPIFPPKLKELVSNSSPILQPPSPCTYLARTYK
jgi:hypothetical protein